MAVDDDHDGHGVHVPLLDEDEAALTLGGCRGGAPARKDSGHTQ